MKKEDVIKAAKELNKVMDLDPKIPVKADVQEEILISEFKKSIDLIEPTDEFTEDTLECIEFITKLKGNTLAKEESPEEEEEYEPEEEENETLEDLILSANTLQDLKTLCKAEDVFKPMRSELTKYKTKTKLQEAMLEMLEAPEEEEDEDEVAEVVDQNEEIETAEVVDEDDDEEDEEEKPEKSKKVKSVNEVREASQDVKGLKVGSKVTFTTAKNATPPDTTLSGTINWIKYESKHNKEYVQIQTKSGVFHKVATAVKINK